MLRLSPCNPLARFLVKAQNDNTRSAFFGKKRNLEQNSGKMLEFWLEFHFCYVNFGYFIAPKFSHTTMQTAVWQGMFGFHSLTKTCHCVCISFLKIARLMCNLLQKPCFSLNSKKALKFRMAKYSRSLPHRVACKCVARGKK